MSRGSCGYWVALVWCMVHVQGRRESRWSMVVLNMTQEAAPSSQPRDLTVVPLEDNPSAVNLNWQPPKQPNGPITGKCCFRTLVVDVMMLTPKVPNIVSVENTRLRHQLMFWNSNGVSIAYNKDCNIVIKAIGAISLLLHLETPCIKWNLFCPHKWLGHWSHQFIVTSGNLLHKMRSFLPPRVIGPLEPSVYCYIWKLLA
jgi:hypothetical protein